MAYFPYTDPFLKVLALLRKVVHYSGVQVYIASKEKI